MDCGRPGTGIPMHVTLDPHRAADPSCPEELPLGFSRTHVRMLIPAVDVSVPAQGIDGTRVGAGPRAMRP
jgi:hypothetical protein